MFVVYNDTANMGDKYQSVNTAVTPVQCNRRKTGPSHSQWRGITYYIEKTMGETKFVIR